MSMLRKWALGLAAMAGMTVAAAAVEAGPRWSFSYGNPGWNGGSYRGAPSYGYGYNRPYYHGYGNHGYGNQGYGNSYYSPYGNSYYGRSYGTPYSYPSYNSYPGYYNSGPTIQFRF